MGSSGRAADGVDRRGLRAAASRIRVNAPRGLESSTRRIEPIREGVAQQHDVADPAGLGELRATRGGPREAAGAHEPRRADSPTKNGAITSCSSSTRLSIRNWVCTCPPPSTMRRRTPRSARSSATSGIVTCSPSPMTVATSPSSPRDPRLGLLRAVDQLLHVARTEERGRRRQVSAAVTVTFAGDDGSPDASRSIRRSSLRTSRRGIVATNGGRADHDRIALGAQLVDAVEVGRVRHGELAAATRCRGSRRSTSRS